MKNLFTFCLILPCCLSFAQTNRVDIGKSYANISKLSTGGTFQPGDTIEVRVTLAVITLSSSATIIDNVVVRDDVPSNTIYVPGSTRISTNEGITYKGNFTDAADTDQGQKIGNTIIISLGRNASGLSGGRIKSDSSRPSFFNSTCIMVACYKVVIDPAAIYGDIINFSGGSISYRMVQPSGSLINYSFPSSSILVYQNIGACSNGRDVSAASDSLGTFASGTVQNRSRLLAFTTTYIKQTLASNSPNDYNYAIVNNLSPTGSTSTNLSIPNPNRVFNIWDVCGDHTNAANPVKGNPPTAPGTRGGYMVIINASYKTDTAYRETLSNLCPDTYYEFSAYFRNICARCSSDSNGRGSSSAGFIPAPGNDSSGVHPNISFIVDGLMYYTSGDILYSRTSPWVKYGFTFKTRPRQTSANFLIQNNSPGGGGNDWALDDIKVAHCGPSLHMNYNPFVLGCSASPFLVQLVDTVKYLFAGSYVHFKWQKSNVGGTVWTDLTGPGTSGVGTPTLVNGQYQFISALPPFLAVYADSGTYYRMVVATSAANLASATCTYSDGSATLIKVINCGTVLHNNILQFKGTLINNSSILKWSCSSERNISYYEIERSEDGIHFNKIETINALNISANTYTFSDNLLNDEKNYYRIKMFDHQGLFKYSKVIVLSKRAIFELKAGDVYFTNQIKAELITPEDGWVNLQLVNESGVQILSKKQWFTKGYHILEIDQHINAPAGLYILSAAFKNEVQHIKFIRIR